MKKFSLTFLIFLTFLLTFLPTVQSEERSVIVKPKEKRDLSVEAKKGLDPALLNAKYHAIIIGNNSYKNLPKLKTAIADAKEVERVLKTQYGFETKLLLDATRNEILTTVNDFRKRLGSKDNLLIYYAGHGEFDKTADRAYWLPVNAQRDDPVDWISATDITDNIKRIASAHILIISDSCYSGTLTRAATGDLSTKGERDEFVKKMMERRSRTLMASGGNEPVVDEGGSGHSVFADAFLRALKEADKGIFTAEELFHGRVKEIVAGKSEQVPEYNNIKNSGHEGGDFVFRLASVPLFPLNKGGQGVVEPEIKPSAEISEELKNIQQEKERLKKEREELEQKKALMEEKNRLEEERQKLEKEKLEVASLQPPPPPVQPKSRLAEKGNMVMIPSGEFMAGEPGSLKGMVISEFYIDKYEVTQREYEQVMGKNPSYFKGCPNCPVESVTWYEAKEYCGKVGKRLPTEWEWEKAAKAGTTTTFYWGDSEGMAGDYAWYDKNSGDKTHPVGQKKPNNYGLYDMTGNVWEWTSTDYSSWKILRGGSWYGGANYVPPSTRDFNSPDYRILNSGFRCAQ
ncbi:MAG: SUMF1/EgtB/PvdO family nonheme iron enzyme [Nitrospinae bacterium]|nr:SUMF1/EgtB/PvdO family nonheme iron enzyme [Nitrospinota bacterium]